MKILFDTNQVLFICQEPARLTERTRDLLWDRSTELFVSAAAFWEIDLKSRARHASGDSKLPLKRPPADMLGYLLRKGVNALDIETRHVIAALTAPIPHKDPFDELMLKQAQVEKLKLLTSDGALAGHPLVLEA